MHCGDQRHLGLCLGYGPALAQPCVPLISTMHGQPFLIPLLKSPADWLTRTANPLSTRWVWAKGCIYFRGIYGPCCAPATHTSTSQDTRPQGLQVAAHGRRAGWDKVRRCRVLVVHRTTQISQSPPPLTTKGSGDLGSISSHKDPTSIGDAGCPWEWPPTDVIPRDITLEGLPPPSPH